MIPIILADLVRRLPLAVLAAVALYLVEPAFHQHGPVDPEMGPHLGALGVSATLANLAALSMLVLLAGFISGDRRGGRFRSYLSHPVSPLALYGLRWLLAAMLTLIVCAGFLVIGQLVAWGEYRGGGSGLWLAAISVVVYGGLLAFLSALLPRGDAWTALGAYFATYLWLTLLAVGAEPLTPGFRQLITLILPPQTAMQDVYEGMVGGWAAWGAAGFSLGYGVVMLIGAGVVLRLREWR
jgi:hypothetical protein